VENSKKFLCHSIPGA